MRHLAVVVEPTLLNSNFAVVTVAVGMVRVPAYSNRFPPTVWCVIWVSSLLWRILHTSRG